MAKFNLSFDMRAPDYFATPPAKLYAEALEMVAYGDTRGIDYALVMEHHSAVDNYIPTPFLLGSAIAARTKTMRIVLGAVILPLHDPVKIAEQIAVVDLISNGRLDVVLGAGYVRAEFQMFKASLSDRAKSMDDGIAIIQRALSGERFTTDGREIFVRPLPVQKPYPPIYIGGGVPATARRAARFNAGLYPLKQDIVPLYKEECARLNREPGPVMGHRRYIHISEDPDKTWTEIAPHVLHVAKAYAAWAEGTTSSSPFEGLHDADVDAIKKLGLYQVVTPDECVAMADDLSVGGYGLQPLMGGLDPKIGWKSVELFAEKVWPRLKK